jgi:hypothetical protein
MAFPEDTGMTKDQKIIRAKVGVLELAKQLGNVSQACKMMGDSRDSFYRFKELYDICGRPRLTSNFLTLQTLGRPAVICPACCAELESAGPDEVRRRRFLSKARALTLLS